MGRQIVSPAAAVSAKLSGRRVWLAAASWRSYGVISSLIMVSLLKTWYNPG
jgi:hypothetical protein